MADYTKIIGTRYLLIKNKGDKAVEITQKEYEVFALKNATAIFKSWVTPLLDTVSKGIEPGIVIDMGDKILIADTMEVELKTDYEKVEK